MDLIAESIFRIDSSRRRFPRARALTQMPLFMILFITLMLVLLGPDLQQVYGLRCYSCGVTASSGDKKCISDPASVEGQNIVTCSRKYCTIQRQELMDPPGKLNTFLRGCEESPLFLNEVYEDPTFKTYYRSCTSDLCNSGDGLDAPGGLSGIDAGASENLLVPGLLSGTTNIKEQLITTTLLLTVSVSLWRFVRC